eukprot:gb/GFBE01019735.1/.p1 GENE.gb/GFBE01019735.1/~~gb/GFBE01019735.1/.p1  ORF type:complete len:210 (+),score=27.14 gb/GFBE01019735.1/:1-630(+)
MIDRAFASGCLVCTLTIPFTVLVYWAGPWITSIMPIMGIVLPVLGCASAVGCCILGQLNVGLPCFTSRTHIDDVEQVGTTAQFMERTDTVIGQQRLPGEGRIEPLDALSVESTGSKEAIASQSPLRPGAPDDSGVRFQVQSRPSGGWTDFEESEMSLLREAMLAGQERARFSARGYEYEVNFSTWMQRNIQTGKERQIRTVPAVASPLF